MASVESRHYRPDQHRRMMVYATRGSLNLTVRVFKCSPVRPFPSTLSALLIHPSLLEKLSDCESGRVSRRFNGRNVLRIKWVSPKHLKKSVAMEIVRFARLKRITILEKRRWKNLSDACNTFPRIHVDTYILNRNKVKINKRQVKRS